MARLEACVVLGRESLGPVEGMEAVAGFSGVPTSGREHSQGARNQSAIADAKESMLLGDADECRSSDKLRVSRLFRHALYAKWLTAATFKAGEMQHPHQVVSNPLEKGHPNKSASAL